MVDNWDKKTTAQVRLDMMKLGWNSDDRLDDSGWGDSFGYSIWFTRWNWHGDKRGTKISFGEHRGPNPSPEAIENAIRDAARNARKAWDTFTDPTDCPEINAKGEIVNDLTLKNLLIKIRGEAVGFKKTLEKMKDPKSTT